jgi:hypothetical protein
MNRVFTFIGGSGGPWQVVSSTTPCGEPLPPVARIAVSDGPVIGLPAGAGWSLRGITSNERYVKRVEKTQLIASQPALGRPNATCAALIPIRKNAEWWSLSQDERRRIFEERSQHIAIGFKYLPAIARRLHHCRDLGEAEPFDFLTWFEYALSDSPAFDKLVAELRASAEWEYVDREVDIRMVYDAV